MASGSPFGDPRYWLDKARISCEVTQDHIKLAMEAIEKNRQALLATTRKWEEHPEGWEHECECALCRSYGDGGST